MIKAQKKAFLILTYRVSSHLNALMLINVAYALYVADAIRSILPTVLIYLWIIIVDFDLCQKLSINAGFSCRCYTKSVNAVC